MVVESKYEKNKNLVAISLANALLNHKETPVFLCVGTDKVVGDAVGAITGEILTKKHKINAFVYGNLDKNVTATNLKNTMAAIKCKHPNSPVVLIDGIFGETEEIGQVKFVEHGSFASGEFHEGVFVGDYSILAVVDTKNIDALSFLHSVKLKNVVQLSEFIADSINRAFKFSLHLS